MSYSNSIYFENQDFYKENSIIQKLKLITSGFSELNDVNTDDYFEHINLDLKKFLPHSADSTRKSSKSEFYNSEYLNRILVSLSTIKEFERELVKKRSLITGSENKYKEAFSYLIQAILPLSPINIIPKITRTNSIYIKFLLDNRYLVRLELFLDEDETFSAEKNFIVLNIDENEEQIFGTHCIAEKAIEYLFNRIENLSTTSSLTNTSDSNNRIDLFEEQSPYSTSL